MKITKIKLNKILKSNGFDALDIKYMTEDLFDESDEVELDKARECVLHDAQDSINKEYDLRASGDLEYIIGYLNRYKEVIVELENLE